MTSKTNNPRDKLDRLADKLREDLYKTSDEEILTEAREDYGDINDSITKVKNVWQSARQATGKRRLLEAKESLDKKRRSQIKSNIPNVTDIIEARKLLRNIIENKTGLIDKITLAARNLNELTDEDVLAILKDLYELGAIPSGDGE